MTGIIASMVGATFSSGAPITAVTFDGTGDYYEKTSITSTATSATKFVVSLTYNTNTTSGQTHMFNMYSTSSSTYGFYIWINNGRSQLVVTQGTTGSEVYNVYTGTSTVTTGAWENIVWYFDMASFANTRCYKNGVSQSLTQASFNGTLSLNFNSISQIKIGQKNTAQTGTGSDYNGKIAQIYVNAVTSEPSINYFWDSDSSLPKDLGSYGTATGLPQPYVYHYGTTTTFVNNYGTGFASYSLTANGNVTGTAGPTYPTIRSSKAITTYGNAKASTAQSVFGGSSIILDGTTDYLQTSASSDFSLTGDFTIEFRIRFNAVDTLYVPICQRASTGIANGEWWCEVTAAEDEMYWGFKNTAGTQYYVNLSLAGTAFAINTWYHIALVRRGNSLQMYQGGTAIGSATTVTGTFGGNAPVTIGALGQGSYSVNGYMDEIRISNVARYTGNFTVPSTPFVYDSSTLLLVHADNDNNATTFIDDANQGIGRSRKTITVSGNAQISTAQSVFNGSSLLFDGTGDFISVANHDDFNYTNKNFTIEMRIRPANFTSFPSPIGMAEAGTAKGWCIQFNTSGVPFFQCSTNGSTINVTPSGPALTAGAWAHLAVVRNGSTITVYKDGVGGTPTTVNADSIQSTTGNLLIGDGYGVNTYFVAAQDFNGYIDEVRISNIARYTANFTPATEQFENDSNTVLLIHGNGANASTSIVDDNGITYRSDAYASSLKLAVPFDNIIGTQDIAYKISGTGLTTSATRTQGSNVVLSNSQVKWSSDPNYVRSADFTPGSSALTYTLPTAIPSSASGTFVIEGFFRAEATGLRWCLSAADSGGRWIVSVANNATANLTTSEGNQNFIYIGTNWTHVAFVCDGGTKRCYYDGIYRGAWLSSNTGFSTLHVGQFNGTDANDYDGQIQDLRVYIGTNKGYTGTNTGAANFTVPSSIIQSY